MTVINAVSLLEAMQALRDHPGARLVQGGTDLMVEVNFNRAAINDVVALRQVNELRRWHVDDDVAGDAKTVRIGAGVPYAEMERAPLCDLVPALAQAARTVGLRRFAPPVRWAATWARARRLVTACQC